MKPHPQLDRCQCGRKPSLLNLGGSKGGWSVVCECGKATYSYTAAETAARAWNDGIRPLPKTGAPHLMGMIADREPARVEVDHGRVRLWTVGCLTDMDASEARELAGKLSKAAELV